MRAGRCAKVDNMPTWSDPNDRAPVVPTGTVFTGNDLTRIGDETFGQAPDLSDEEQVERGIQALRQIGLVLDRGGPPVTDENGDVMYSFVRLDAGLR